MTTWTGNSISRQGYCPVRHSHKIMPSAYTSHFSLTWPAEKSSGAMYAGVP